MQILTTKCRKWLFVLVIEIVNLIVSPVISGASDSLPTISAQEDLGYLYHRSLEQKKCWFWVLGVTTGLLTAINIWIFTKNSRHSEFIEKRLGKGKYRPNADTSQDPLEFYLLLAAQYPNMSKDQWTNFWEECYREFHKAAFQVGWKEYPKMHSTLYQSNLHISQSLLQRIQFQTCWERTWRKPLQSQLVTDTTSQHAVPSDPGELRLNISIPECTLRFTLHAELVTYFFVEFKAIHKIRKASEDQPFVMTCRQLWQLKCPTDLPPASSDPRGTHWSLLRIWESSQNSKNISELPKETQNNQYFIKTLYPLAFESLQQSEDIMKLWLKNSKPPASRREKSLQHKKNQDNLFKLHLEDLASFYMWQIFEVAILFQLHKTTPLLHQKIIEKLTENSLFLEPKLRGVSLKEVQRDKKRGSSLYLFHIDWSYIKATEQRQDNIHLVSKMRLKSTPEFEKAPFAYLTAKDVSDFSHFLSVYSLEI